MEPLTTLHYSDNGYLPVNGIDMYYEIYGHGKPLVLIHGGGSTIQSNFGQVIPRLAKNRKVIAMELQAHGRTSDRGLPSSFQQDADDVAALLKSLSIEKAEFLGFSNGATTTLQIAIRHPKLVEKIILGSPLYKRNGVPSQFWDFMNQASLADMPQQLQEAFLAVNPNPRGLQLMHDRDALRMVHFKDIPEEQIVAIQVSTLIIMGDQDVILPEHAIELQRKIAGSKLAILPGTHGEYLGEITTFVTHSKTKEPTILLIESFLEG